MVAGRKASGFVESRIAGKPAPTSGRSPVACRSKLACDAAPLVARSRGFTLLELLVALAVFAILSAMAYGGLRTVLDGRARVEEQAERLGQLQTAFAIMERDVEQTLGRTIRDSYGDEQPAMLGGEFGSTVLELTRTGWRNPTGAGRSSLQRVAYRLVDGELSRTFWLVVDRAQDSAPVERVLLNGVETMELRYLDNTLEWQTSWPDSNVQDKSVMPRAVEVAIELEGFGRVRRVFRAPPGEAAQRQVAPPPGPPVSSP